MKTIAIVQARMGSTRFPGKTMAILAGQPMIEVLINRIKRAKLIEKIVVATTNDPLDNQLVDWLKTKSIDVYRGSSNDVLDRVWRCAKIYSPKIIARITADDPLKDPEIVDNAIRIMTINSNIDYVSNTIRPTYPEGLDVEVVTMNALECAAQLALKPSEREHVTPYIWNRPWQFRIHSMESEEDHSNIRLTVDKVEDLELIQKIIEKANGDININYKEIMSLIRRNVELQTENPKIVRNEGYLKSIKEES